MVALPLPRVTGFTEYYNPRPSHLVGGALVSAIGLIPPQKLDQCKLLVWNKNPAYFSRRAHSASRTPSRVRTQSLSQPLSIISMDSTRSRERSRERSISPLVNRTQRTPPGRRDSEPASNDGGRSRSPSLPRRRYPEPTWKRQMRTMPVDGIIYGCIYIGHSVLHFQSTGFL